MFVVFFTVLCGLFGLMQYRLFRLFRKWLRRAFDERDQRRWLHVGHLFLIGVNSLFVLQFFVRASDIYDAPFIQATIVYPMGIVFAIIVFSFLVISIADVSKFVYWFGHRAVTMATGSPAPAPDPPLSEGRRRFLRRGGLTAAAAVGSFPVIASIATARDYQVNRLDFSLEDLPSEFDGLTLVQVSDIHSGIYMTEQNMTEIFAIVNSLNPDLIMVTGDFVDSSDSQIEPLSNALKMLKARHSVYGCLGNHDHFATAEKVSAAAEERGIIMLNNSHKTIVINNRAISIIGVDDAGRGAANFARFDEALRSVDPESFKIMLSHRPDVWDECRTAGSHLTLSGHTHGGQVGIRLGPLNLNPVHLVHKYAMGHFEEEGKHLYVNVGVGMVGVPIRMVRPEIAALTLRSA